MGSQITDITGQRFGRLVAISVDRTRASNGRSRPKWLCRCDCGVLKKIDGTSIRTGLSRSCGCLRDEGNNRSHGRDPRRLYNIWTSMKGRCLNNQSSSYKSYGGRGITVCDEWLAFEAFRDWALGNGYQPHLTIDRRDNNGNYTPDNCRWATAMQQARNTRQTRPVICENGRRFGSIAEASEATGTSQSHISSVCRGERKRAGGYHWAYAGTGA